MAKIVARENVAKEKKNIEQQTTLERSKESISTRS
jgi:hypothetical protein